ncbi:MAG: DUF1189 family protein [Bacilli bacterium]
MLNIFFHSFSFSHIFGLKKAPLKTFILYFLFLVLLISFPLNYQIIKNDGFRGLNTVTYELRKANPNWLPDQLPSDMDISETGLHFIQDQEYQFSTTVEDVMYTVIINPKTSFVNLQNTIVLGVNEITYYDAQGHYLKGDYQHVSEVVDFAELKIMEKSQAVDLFLSLIDGSVSPYTVFYSVFTNTIIQLGMNIILVIILASIFLLIRVNFKPVTNFSDNLKIIISSMTIPGLISFLVGILGIMEINSFSVVLFQFLTPLIGMLAIYRGSKEQETALTK